MKTFEGLFAELQAKAKAGDPASGTVKELAKGTHFIGKKIVEEAGEVWIASEYEGREKTAEEISQLLYHLQVMMIDRKLELEDVYANNNPDVTFESSSKTSGVSSFPFDGKLNISSNAGNTKANMMITATHASNTTTLG